MAMVRSQYKHGSTHCACGCGWRGRRSTSPRVSGDQLKGSNHPAARGSGLTMAIARQIRRHFATGGYTKADLSEKFGVNRRTVLDIIRGNHWSVKEAQQ